MISTLAAVLIEDHEAACEFFSSCFPYSHDNVTFQQLDKLKTPITSKNREFVKDQLNSEKGGLLLLLDLELYSLLPDAEVHQIRSDILKDIETILATSQVTDDADITLTAALQELATLQGLDQPGKLIIDGLEFALAAIRNRSLRPLIIRLATSHGRRDHTVMILKAVTNILRGPKHCCDIGSFGMESVRAIAERAVSKAKTRANFYRDLIDNDVALRISTIEPDCSPIASLDPPEVLRTFLKWIRGLDHDPMLRLGLEDVRVQFSQLLAISEEDWRDRICPALAPHLTDALRAFGAGNHRGFGVLGAWLLSLSAYRMVDGSRPWWEIFDPTDVSAAKPETPWREMLLTPSLSGTGETGSLFEAIEHYYRMCLSLFLREGGSVKGPLNKVVLRDDRLSLRLGFSKKQRETLAINICRWRNGYLNSPGCADHKWPNPLKDGPNSSARSVWNWWLATALEDYPHVERAIFDSSEFPRMFITGTDDETEFVFGNK